MTNPFLDPEKISKLNAKAQGYKTKMKNRALKANMGL